MAKNNSVEKSINASGNKSNNASAGKVANKSNGLLTFIVITAAVIELLCIAFFLYASNYYTHDDEAELVLLNDKNLKQYDDYIFLEADEDGAYYDTNTLFVMYPGAKVEYTSYLPFLEKLQKQGINCVILKVKFNLAVLDVDAADAIRQAYPDYDHYVLAGHSFGGTAASMYFGDHEEEYDALFLLASFIYGDVEDIDKALTIYGSEDGILDTSKIGASDNVYVIEGGNHCQFGDYGFQKGDGLASISREKQQETAVEQILLFLDENVYK